MVRAGVPTIRLTRANDPHPFESETSRGAHPTTRFQFCLDRSRPISTDAPPPTPSPRSDGADEPASVVQKGAWRASKGPASMHALATARSSEPKFLVRGLHEVRSCARCLSSGRA